MTSNMKKSLVSILFVSASLIGYSQPAIIRDAQLHHPAIVQRDDVVDAGHAWVAVGHRQWAG